MEKDVYKFIKEQFGFDDEKMKNWEKFLSKSNLADFGNILNLIETAFKQQNKWTDNDVKKAIELGRILEEETRGKKVEVEIECLMGLTEICTHGMDVKYTPEQILQTLEKQKNS